MKQHKKRSALTHVLLALVPYSRENMLVSFRPNQFFNELERTSGYKRNTLQNAYWRGQRKGFIKKIKASPQVTSEGLDKIRPFMARHLGEGARLMVIFDIPENKKGVRQQFRELLKSWEFTQIQKSVWETDMDYRELLVDAISELGIGGCVEISESVRLFPGRSL